MMVPRHKLIKFAYRGIRLTQLCAIQKT